MLLYNTVILGNYEGSYHRGEMLLRWRELCCVVELRSSAAQGARLAAQLRVRFWGNFVIGLGPCDFLRFYWLYVITPQDSQG